ncbi:alpha-ketoglutarate dehydrogenase component 4 [Panulirus ornatus]|uniref:alpha-ketoglutarate dehydrogenase component 4 n=1 Tax=Panulirus ornatus TaxID=150431 RepID=UPI003A84B120
MQVNARMSSLAGSAWKAVKPHIPMIKFRKGGLTELVHGVSEPVAATGPAPGGSAAPPSQAPVVLEEWQVPLRYRRELISEEEIEYINRGGPA